MVLKWKTVDLDIRKKFLTQKVVRHENSLPRETVGAPSLEMFKARLNEALGSLFPWCPSPWKRG